MMIWDSMWSKYEKRTKGLPKEQWIELATKSIDRTVNYLEAKGKAIVVKQGLRNSICRFRDSISKNHRLSIDEEKKRQLLIEEFEDDDVNTEQPGIVDILMAFDFFIIAPEKLCIDDLADCLSYCNQCVSSIEVLGSMNEGQSYSEKEYEEVENGNKSCIDSVEFQRKLIEELQAKVKGKK
jgi:hypothetical protein